MVENNIANTAQHEYWNTVAGPRWVGLGGFVEQRVRAVNDLLLARSAVAPGERVIEIGCGTGAATVPFAEAGCAIFRCCWPMRRSMLSRLTVSI